MSTSLLARLLAPMAETPRPGPADDYWYNPVGVLSAAGLKVTPEQAVKSSAVFASLRVLGQTIGALPCIMYERITTDGRDGKRRATGHPLYDLLRWQPNVRQTAYEFWRLMTIWGELYGNAYAEIVPGPRGVVDQLVPIHPRRVRPPELLTDGDVRYKVRDLNGHGETVYLSDELLHIPGMSEDGVSGLGIPDVARDAIGLALAAEGYASRFFSQGANFGTVLEHPGTLSEEASKRLAASFQAAFSGVVNSHRTVVLEEGIKANRSVISPEQAQAHQTRQGQLVEVARFFGIPPHKIGILDRATWGNIEHQAIEFVTDAIVPRTEAISQRIRKDLLIAKDRFFAEFLLDSLLRGDTKTRYEAHGMAIRDGWKTRNEARVSENLDPLPGLDEPLEQRNMAVAGTQEEPEPEPPGSRQAFALAEELGRKVVDKELWSIEKAAKRSASDAVAFNAWTEEFYSQHAEYVARTMKVSPEEADAYCQHQAHDLINFGLSVTGNWQATKPRELAEMALGAVV